jgi:hypothetical protein
MNPSLSINEIICYFILIQFIFPDELPLSIKKKENIGCIFDAAPIYRHSCRHYSSWGY